MATFSVFCVVLLSCSLIGGIVSEDCAPYKVIYNYVFDKQVAAIDNQLSIYDKPYINMDKMMFDVKPDVRAFGVKLYDVTHLRPGKTYLWTAKDDTTFAEIVFGLKDMKLEIGKLLYKGKSYNNATVDVSNAFLHSLQATQYTENSCTQKYSDIHLLPVSKAVINGQMDITDDFNGSILPWINQQLSSTNFTDLVQNYFDNCNPQSAANLVQLITSPYSK